MKGIHIGTSGWHYKHWHDVFYPAEIQDESMLRYYCGNFKTVEINNSFYHLPKSKTLKAWHTAVPDGFVFAVKASRYITHMKKLKNCSEPVKKFLNRVETLRDKMGPVVFQLPPRWSKNPERLEEFLSIFPSNHRFAFEFRDGSWFASEIYDLLAEYNAAFCIYDFNRRSSPREITADFVYLRLHGPDGAYRGSYSASYLSELAGEIKGWAEGNREVFCYFDNDQKGYAAENARQLQALIA
ncbi:MAG: DUF72 domain-containing protein [Elusimicrobia bacterium]|nr:DUF72 domain-containing protein [Elusimicrobiota bacterium]MBD3412253.1 DUF72 domain-containing protein [Elusimicrobiota bacterium]